MQPLLRPKADIDQTATLLLRNQGKQVEKFTDIANTLMARDYKGFGNQAMNAVMESPQSISDCGGIVLGKSPSYDKGELKGLSRTIDTGGTNGVVEWRVHYNK